jgi:hypothetical protein
MNSDQTLSWFRTLQFHNVHLFEEGMYVGFKCLCETRVMPDRMNKTQHFCTPIHQHDFERLVEIEKES